MNNGYSIGEEINKVRLDSIVFFYSSRRHCIKLDQMQTALGTYAH